MATRTQVLELVEAGMDYETVGRRLAIPPGLAYLIATGMPADGGDNHPETERQRPGVLPSSQHLCNPPPENPTSRQVVRDWISGRVAADPAMRRAAAARDAEPGEVSDTDTDTDAIVVLTRDHNRVKALQQQVEAMPGKRSKGSPEQMSRRKSVVDMITMRLSRHEAVEEQYFWPAVRSALPDGDAWADGALEQERHGKDLLTALGKLDADTDEFDERVEQLVLALRIHVAYEERLFLLLRAAMPDERRAELGAKLLAAQKLAPTRPHPHTPASPAVLKTAGVAAAAADKIRDAAGDRPAKRKGKAG